MSLEDDLFRIEEGFWLAGSEHFLANLDKRCLLAFPQEGEMHGVWSRKDIAETASTPDRWRELQVANRQLLEAGQDVAIISYRADVKRADGQPYAALVSSGYVKRPDGWKLAFHQHSPLEAEVGLSERPQCRRIRNVRFKGRMVRVRYVSAHHPKPAHAELVEARAPSSRLGPWARRPG